MDALSSQGRSLHILLKAAIIIAAGVAVLYPALSAPWYGDDDLYITANPLIRDPDRLWKAWFQPGSFVEYYPIDQTVQWLQWKYWGLQSPFNYHLSNLVLHLLSALLLWRLFSKLGLKLAWIGGLVFAIHPLMVDSVAVANELKNTLSLPPFLLAMAFYLDFEKSRKPHCYVLALFFFLVAMLCKITMFFFPIIILLYALWKRDRIAWPDLKAAFPFFVISFLLGIVTLHAGVIYNETIHYHSPGPIHLGGLTDRIALAGLTLAFYFGRCLFPLHPMPFYPLWSIEPFSFWFVIPWLSLALVVGCCWSQRRGWGRPVLFALAFFILGLLPYLGFIETSYMCLTWVVDHFVYIPIIGLIGLAVAGIELAGKNLPQKFLSFGMATGLVALALLAFQTWSYARLFSDTGNLWAYNLRYNPGMWFVREQYAQILYQKHEVEAAIAQLQESTRLNPQFSNAQLDLGLYLSSVGRIAEGASAFEAATRVDPDSLAGHIYLAHALAQLGRTDESIDQYQQALRIQPASLGAHFELSELLASEGRFAEAIALAEDALRFAPGDRQFEALLEQLQNRQGRPSIPPSSH